MTFGKAIAICDNMDRPAERAKFSDDEILTAIRTLMDAKAQIRYITKPALFNACQYLMDREGA